MTKQLHSITVAKEFLKLSEDGLTQLQLQKLVYFAHAIYMFQYKLDHGLVSDNVEAWKYGPVFRGLWNVTKDYGRKKITHLDDHVTFNEGITDDQRIFIKVIFDSFGHLSGFMLSSMTHQVGSPWHKIYVENGDTHGTIPDKLILDYFAELNKKNKK